MDPIAKRIRLDLRQSRVSGVKVHPPGRSYRSHWAEADGGGLDFDAQVKTLQRAVAALERRGWRCRMAPGPAIRLERAQLALPLVKRDRPGGQ